MHIKRLLNKKLFFAVAFSLFWGQAQALDLRDSYFALNSSLLSNLLAKEMCSCIYVTGADVRFGTQVALQKCLERGNLPMAKKLLFLIIKKSIRVESDSVRVDPTLLAKIVTAGHDQAGVATYDRAHPEFGCSLKF